MPPKGIVTVATAMMLGVAGLGQAATIVIGDFEDGTPQGWAAIGSRSTGIVADTFTGSGFLMAVDFSATSGFDWSLQLNDIANLDLLLLNNVGGPQVVEFDVYWDSSDWTGDGTALWRDISYNYAGGWTQIAPTAAYASFHTSEVGLHADHVVYDFLAAGFPLNGAPTLFAQLWLSTQTIDDEFGDPIAGGVFYIDNITITVPDAEPVIPEPATFLLLGTGLAAAGVRRRMKQRS